MNYFNFMKKIRICPYGFHANENSECDCGKKEEEKIKPCEKMAQGIPCNCSKCFEFKCHALN